MVQFIITAIISAVGLTGILVYLGKLIINRSIDLGIEKFKANLNKDLETHKYSLLKNSEEYKSNLQRISLEHQVRFTRLHEERGESIKQLFQLLVTLQEKLEYFTSKFQGPDWRKDEERENSATAAHKELNSYFDLNRIYYPSSICSKVDEILSSSWAIIVDMSVSKVSEDRRLWSETNAKVSKDLKQARLLLQDEFKKLLGVE